MKVQKATLLFLIKDDQILLALKKRGFGKGNWNGAGGKVEVGETSKVAAIREAKEEINVTVKNPKKVALLDFYLPKIEDKEAWIQRTFVYVAKDWIGKPQETEEMNPKWFKFAEIPYEEMWSDDFIWLPKVLAGLPRRQAGQRIKAKFWFNKKNEVVKYKIDSKN